MLKLTLFLLLVLLSNSYKCIHDHIVSKIRLIPPEQHQLKFYSLVTATVYSPIRVSSSYTSSLKPPQPDMDESILRMVSIAKKFWSRVISVQPTKIMFPPSQNYCAEYRLTEEDRRIKDADLHFFVTSQSEPNSSFIAWASACAIAPNGRPIFGQVNFNAYFLSVTNKTNYQFQKDLQTTLHEMIHVLAFSPPLFAYWATKPLLLKQYNFNTIASREITEWMSSHFECNIGAPLENQGEAGSIGAHWDRSVFQNEIMTASDLTERLVFSNLTMALLASTGWYKVDRSLAEGFIWGKREGCKFISSLCKGGFPEFCYNSGMVSCTYDSTAIASCISDPFSDSCSYYAAYKNTICQEQTTWGLPNTGSVFEHNSRCFKSNIVQGGNARMNLDFRCFRSRCVGASVLITVGNTLQVLCERDKQVININNQSFKGFLNCPDNLDQFCMTPKYSEGYCYQHGYSINGECVCAEGYNGTHCNNTCASPFVSHKESCVASCPQGTYMSIGQARCVDSCPPSSYVSNNTCLQCPLYCLSCSKGMCSECLQGSVLTNGTCKAIVALESGLFLGLGMAMLLMALMLIL